jgi:hypothetical protein
MIHKIKILIPYIIVMLIMTNKNEKNKYVPTIFIVVHEREAQTLWLKVKFQLDVSHVG